ncbi:MAG: ABC transporter ATP-binding protein/permease [Lachnospiraceae bacterium]|nr:ABC transporter ATP-binding protein/permease [Lachnospiraceae bacterium]
MRNSNKKHSYFYPYIRLIKLMFKTIPGEMTVCCLADVFHALSIVLAMYGMQLLIDGAEEIYYGKPTNSIIVPLILFIALNMLTEICNGIGNYHLEYLSPRMLIKMNTDLQNKISKLDYICFEDPEMLDSIEKAKNGIENNLLTAYFVLSTITLYLPYYIFMGIYLRNVNPMLLIVLLLIFIPVLLGNYLRFKVFAKTEDEAANVRRKKEAYEDAICDLSTFKETRMLGAFHYFFKGYTASIGKLNSSLMSAEKKQAKNDLICQGLTAIGYLGIIGLLIAEVLSKRAGIGSFTAVLFGITTMYGLAQEVFVNTFKSTSKQAASLNNYWKLMDYKEGNAEDTATEKTGGEASSNSIENGLTLNNVYFSYPGVDKDALHNVSLDIREGETIAVVGENGSGKTTLAKMIMGLLRPRSGNMYYLGSKVNYQEYVLKVSAVFQDYIKYQMRLDENISISRQGAQPVQEDINEAIKSAGLELNQKHFPDGKETMLSKEFGGVDLSGGLWQRVAIARGLYRKHEIIILDEPTAAIDPIEEARVYNEFAAITKGKIGIIITHRLGAAKIADRIVVLKNGEIENVGTHDYLLKNDMYYKQLYDKQAVWYQ